MFILYTSVLTSFKENKMQTNPISAQSFKGNYQLPELDTDRAIELARALRNMEDEFKHQKEGPSIPFSMRREVSSMARVGPPPPSP